MLVFCIQVLFGRFAASVVEFEVEVEGLGRLANRIVAGTVPVREDCGAQPSASEEVLSTAMGGDWEFRGIRAPRGPGAQFYESTLKA